MGVTRALSTTTAHQIMTDKKKHRDSGGGKKQRFGGDADSIEVSADDIRALRESIEQQRMAMEQVTRAMTQVAAKQASLQQTVQRHLSYETERDDAAVQQEIDGMTCCGISFARFV